MIMPRCLLWLKTKDRMPAIIDTPEQIEAHKAHANNPQPDTCDLCWIEAPLTQEELIVINMGLINCSD